MSRHSDLHEAHNELDDNSTTLTNLIGSSQCVMNEMVLLQFRSNIDANLGVLFADDS